MSALNISYSNGRTRDGKFVAYIRPKENCLNKSRRVWAHTAQNLERVIELAIKDHYTPLIYYKVDGHIIGSKSEKGALKEYWAVCERQKIAKEFEVVPLTTPQQ